MWLCVSVLYFGKERLVKVKTCVFIVKVKRKRPAVLHALAILINVSVNKKTRCQTIYQSSKSGSGPNGRSSIAI